MRVRQWMFDCQQSVCESYGYEPYGAPILELMDLYRQKSSEEIVNEQLYSFIDRGEREVAIRPEMTPTVARMVVARSARLQRPVRWYSIANFMRYERPGRGRLREFYQLNVDLLGASGMLADAEVLCLAVALMQSYGARRDQFVIRINHRSLYDTFFADLSVDLKLLGRLLDKREKLTAENFARELKELGLDDREEARVKEYLDLDREKLKSLDSPAARELSILLDYLGDTDAAESVVFDPGIMRGFDYYTGLIFEVNDCHPENKRALFGGGRYDALLKQMGGPDWPAVGFGMGDVTLENFLRSHDLLPAAGNRSGFFFASLEAELDLENQRLADKLRPAVPVEFYLGGRSKFGKQLELAEKKGYRYVLLRGSTEKAEGNVALKDLTTGKQESLPLEGLAAALKARC
ncbi:MAG: histidine--tRNA ligase [Spirochaetales bacterium]|nr:histidine--tRNA ligase [Spirochaetales bacterium]